MLIQNPPKYAVSGVIGYIKGKSAIAVARQFSGWKEFQRRKFLFPQGKVLKVRGHAVSTVGFEEGQIRRYGTRTSRKDKALKIMGSFK